MKDRNPKLMDAVRLFIQQRTHRLTFLPTLILYLNDVCNSRCLTCAIWQNNDRLKKPGERHMSDEVLADVYSAVGRWKPRHVLLSGGEPTLHPRFAEIVERIRDLGSEVALITNGLTLASMPPRELQLIAEVYVSFDAFDAAGYERIRGVDGFAKLEAGVRHVLEVAPSTKVVARCTLQHENVRFLPELVGAAVRIGFTKISFLGVDVSSDAFARNYPDHAVEPARIQPTAEDIAAMEQGIVRLEAENAGAFIEGGIAKLRDIQRYFRALLGQTPFPEVRCNAPWFSTVVETTGKIRGCFFHRQIGTLGGINAPEAIAFRRSLDVSRNPICQSCVCSKLMTVRVISRFY